MLDAILWLFGRLGGGVLDLFAALADPSSWLNWADRQALARFIYFGGSTEFFFVVLDIILLVFVIGAIWRPFLWRVVRGAEAFQNTVGRVVGWALLIMVIQQVLIIVLQRIFRVSEIPVGPFGVVFTRDLSWFSEQLKLYQAMVVALACSYTFIQGGHVRVDLVYSRLSFHGKRMFDMVGSLIFVLPLATVTWLFAWFFMWRHLVTPPVAAADKLETVLRKARLLKWNVETIGFSPNGFDGYFLFKVLMVLFAGFLFLQGVVFFFRNFLEYIEGPQSAGRHLDRDVLEELPPDAAAAR